jgi:hypothetical protein
MSKIFAEEQIAIEKFAIQNSGFYNFMKTRIDHLRNYVERSRFTCETLV